LTGLDREFPGLPSASRPAVGPAGQHDVVEMADPGRGDGEGAVGLAVVAKDLVGLEQGQSVFDAGADFVVPGVVILFPRRQFATVAGAAVGHDHLGIAAESGVGHPLALHEFPIDTAGAVDDRVVAVARLRVARGDHEAGVRVDGDLRAVQAENLRSARPRTSQQSASRGRCVRQFDSANV
jgi:hypothetical protein